MAEPILYKTWVFVSFTEIWWVTHFEFDVVDCVLKCDDTRAETRLRFVGETDESIYIGGGVSSVGYWQASCAHQPAGFVLLVQACVLQSCDAYWLPTPFSCFPFTSPPVRYRVLSHFNWTLPTYSLHEDVAPFLHSVVQQATYLLEQSVFTVFNKRL